MKDDSNKNNTDSITLDDLARVVQNGFSEAEQKRNEMEIRLKEEIRKEIRQDIRKEGQDIRDYVDKKNTELKGELISYDKKIIEKVDTLTDTLGKKNHHRRRTIKSNIPLPIPRSTEKSILKGYTN